MKLVTIVYVTVMDRSVPWYRRLLPGAEVVSASPFWTELALGDGASLALHAARAPSPGTQLGLGFTADRRLEQLRDDFEAAGVEVARDIADEPFGRSMVICDPDGLAIQINEHDPAKYPPDS